MQDWELLREYVDKSSQMAFARLVERHMNLVYSICLRELGNVTLAEDATQVVFLIFARKAASLRPGIVVVGWLFNTARFVARDIHRQEMRQQQREQKVLGEMMEQSQVADQLGGNTLGGNTWADLEPLLYDGLKCLSARERNALLLRFFEGKNFKDTACALGISPEAAEKRVARALEKLRRYFARHGYAVSLALLGSLLRDHALRAAPNGCSAIVTQITTLVSFRAGGRVDSAFAAHSTAARLMTVQNALGNVVSGGMTGLGASGALTAGVSSVVSAREGAGAADTIINGIMTSGVNTSSAPAELAGAKVVSLTEGVLKAMFMTKMQLSMLACFGLTLVGTGAGHLAQLALAAVKHRPPHLPQHHILPTVAEPSLSTRQHQSQADSFMFMVRGRGRVDGKWSIGRVPVATKETVPLNNSPFLQAHVQVHTDVQAQPAAGTKVASIEAAGIEPGVYSQAITQAASVSDGIYKLTSLGAGSASVTVYDPTGKKSVPTLQNIKEVAGQRAAAAQRASEPNPMPRTASLEGQVRDETGQPVAGAKIMSPDGDPRLQVTSDAAGKFVLTSLPPGSVMVVAGLTNRIGEARDVIGQQPLIVTLAPVKPLASNDIQRAYELLDDLWASTEGTPYYRTNIPATLAAYNPDLAVQLAARQDGTLDENVLGEIILNLALADPTRAAAWVPAQLPRFKNSDMLFGIRSLLAYALAGVQPDLARDFYTQAKAYAQEQTARDAKNAQALARRGITLSHAAHNLGLYDEANQWTQAAITAVKASNGQERQGMLASLACLDYDETVQMMDALPADQRKLQIHMAISAVAATDPKLARRWLDKLIAVEKATPRGGGYSGEATRTLVQAVGHTDPTGALDLARSVSNSYNKFICLAIAAQFQPRTTALQVLHEASDLGRQHHLAAGDVIARVAALTYDLDPKLGTDLFAQAKEQWEAQRTQQEGQETYDNGTAAFAYYYSRIDPAASRLLLEGEFAYQMQRPKTANHGLWQHGWQLRGLVEAMAAIDVDRALELSYILPSAAKEDPSTNYQAEAQRAIAQYLLLSTAERRRRAFQEWGATP